MTDLQITIKNLKIGLEMLPKLAEEDPSIKKDFDMYKCGAYTGSTIDDQHCQTNGCLLGHLARCFDLNKKVYYSEISKTFDYGLFSMIKFPYLNKNLDYFSFLFCENWLHYQPTFEQALERVSYFIEHNGNFDWDFRKKSFV